MRLDEASNDSPSLVTAGVIESTIVGKPIVGQVSLLSLPDYT